MQTKCKTLQMPVLMKTGNLAIANRVRNCSAHK